MLDWSVPSQFVNAWDSISQFPVTPCRFKNNVSWSSSKSNFDSQRRISLLSLSDGGVRHYLWETKKNIPSSCNLSDISFDQTLSYCVILAVRITISMCSRNCKFIASNLASNGSHVTLRNTRNDVQPESISNITLVDKGATSTHGFDCPFYR